MLDDCISSIYGNRLGVYFIILPHPPTNSFKCHSSEDNYGSLTDCSLHVGPLSPFNVSSFTICNFSDLITWTFYQVHHPVATFCKHPPRAAESRVIILTRFWLKSGLNWRLQNIFALSLGAYSYLLMKGTRISRNLVVPSQIFWISQVPTI